MKRRDCPAEMPADQRCREVAGIRNYPPERLGGLVVLGVPKNATADMILRLLESLLRQADIVERLPGWLAIIEWGNVRIRPKA